MSLYLNRQDIADKADYEGGILELLFGYGLSLEDLPEGDTELREVVAELLAMEPTIERLRQMLPEPGEEEC